MKKQQIVSIPIPDAARQYFPFFSEKKGRAAVGCNIALTCRPYSSHQKKENPNIQQNIFINAAKCNTQRIPRLKKGGVDAMTAYAKSFAMLLR